MRHTHQGQPCFFGLFHARSKTRPETLQHIFAVAVRRHENGQRQTLLVDTGQDGGHAHVLGKDPFNTAIVFPVPTPGFEALRDYFTLAQALGSMTGESLMPYYFSKDMSPDPHFERRGCRAVDPFGRMDAPNHARQDTYRNDPNAPVLARVNCVVLSLLAAHIAGLDQETRPFSSVRRAAAFEKALGPLSDRGVVVRTHPKTPEGTRFIARRHEDPDTGSVWLTLSVPRRANRVAVSATLDTCETLLRPAGPGV